MAYYYAKCDTCNWVGSDEYEEDDAKKARTRHEQDNPGHSAHIEHPD